MRLDKTEEVSDKRRMKEHARLVDALGGGTKIARWLTEQSGELVDCEAVYKWKRNGVAWRWRPLLAQLARQRGIALPPQFLPDEAA